MQYRLTGISLFHSKKTLIFAMAAVLLMALGSTPCYGQKTKKSSKKVENSVSYEEGSPAWTLRDFYDAYHKMENLEISDGVHEQSDQKDH